MASSTDTSARSTSVAFKRSRWESIPNSSISLLLKPKYFSEQQQGMLAIDPDLSSCHDATAKLSKMVKRKENETVLDVCSVEKRFKLWVRLQRHLKDFKSIKKPSYPCDGVTAP